MAGARRTLKKDIASRRRSHKRQAGGAAACGTTTKSNYTFYFAGTTYPGPAPAAPTTLPTDIPSTGYPTGTYAAATGGTFSTKAVTPLGTFGPRFNANVGATGAMIFDAAGMMYCASNYGIVKIDPTGTITQFVTPVQLMGGTATTSSYLHIAFGRNNTIVAMSFGSASLPIKVIALPAGTVTTPKAITITEAATGITSDSAGNIYYTSYGSFSFIYKIDAITYATTVFAGTTTSTINVTFGNDNFGALIAYHPTENSIYYFDMRNITLYRLSLSPLTSTVITTLRDNNDMFYSIALDPIRNIMYFGAPNWGPWQGMIYSLNLSLAVGTSTITTAVGTSIKNTLQRYSGLSSTVTTRNSLIGGTSSYAGYSTVCTGDRTSASFISTVVYPTYIWFIAVDPDGNVYVPGEYPGATGIGGNGTHIYLISPIPPAQDPTTSSVISQTLTSVTIRWSDDTSASSYTFTVSPLPSDPVPVLSAAATTATFTGLTAGVSYTIKINGLNRFGSSPGTGPGATVIGTAGIDTTDFALTRALPSTLNLIGSTPSVTAVYLSWTGLLSVQYVMYTITPIGPSSSASLIQGTIPQTAGTSITQSPYIVRGLAPETTYSVTITGSMQSTFPTGVYTATTAPISFTTPPLLPVFLGTLVGGLSNALGTSLTSNAGTALDGAGNMYIASGTCIYKVSPSTSTTNWLFDTTQTLPTPTSIPYNPTRLPIGVGGSTLSLFAGISTRGAPSGTTAAGAPSTTPQTGSAIRFGQITGITYNSTQNALYVADSLYSVIVKVTISPVTATIVAGQTSTAGKVDGAFGVNTLTATTNGMISTVANQLYITDYTNSIVRTLNTTVTPHTMGTVQSAASTPTAVSSASSIAELPNGWFIVASAGTHTLQLLKITSGSASASSSAPVYYAASVYAGISGTPGNTNGPLASATFNKPTGVAVDTAGNIYVYDSGNFSIRVIIGSMVYTYLGGTAGNVDGPAASASLNGGTQPAVPNAVSGLMFDSNGFLYISDTTNNALRVVAPYPANQVINNSQLTGYRASAAQASSAYLENLGPSSAEASSASIQMASSAVAQAVSSPLAQAISGARQSSAVAQQDSSAQAQAVSGAQQSSAVAQQASTAQASSALAQAISGAEQSSAVAQQASTAQASSALAQAISGSRESSAVAQVASSALAQAISGAQQSSAVAQQASTAQASSALAQAISGAQQSSAVAQQASTAQASSALAQAISGSRESSATAQQASSALAQSISGAQQSSAVAQQASTAQASSALAQAISGSRESSATAQQASSALAQSISGAQQSSAVAQQASTAQASSALAQSISGAQQSSAVAQQASTAVASSALAQAISGSRESSAVAQVASSALAQAISGAQQSSAVAQQASTAVASSALAQAISGAQASSATAQQASSALAQSISGAQQSSAVAQQASSALAQSISGAEASSALAQVISGAGEYYAKGQVASSAVAQAISGAQASSATAQQASSALAQSISGAQQSSAVAQQASTAVASSALAQSISGAQASSATAQQASSALAQAISGAQQSSAVAQQASSALAQSISGAEASSALAQVISGAGEYYAKGQVASSAVAQAISGAQASSALAQSISGAQQSSAVAQQASTAQASSALAQAISGAQASSATAQQASSALAQAISGAQQSSAVGQQASTAQASSALAQSISGAEQSSAVAQQASTAQASSALAQAISGAQQSSAVAQQASSALAQSISGAQQSSAVAQADSSAQQQAASSSYQQRDSSAQQQTVSSAVQQTASSADKQNSLGSAIAIKDGVKATLLEIQADIVASAQAIYSPGSSTASGSTMLTLQNKMLSFDQAKRNLLNSATAIFQVNPEYQDPTLQTIIQDNTLSAFGVKKVFDALRNKYIFLDTNNRIISSPLTPYLRAYTSGASQRGGGKDRKDSRKSSVLFYQV